MTVVCLVKSSAVVMVIAEAESAIDKIIRRFILLKFRLCDGTWRDGFVHPWLFLYIWIYSSTQTSSAIWDGALVCPRGSVEQCKEQFSLGHVNEQPLSGHFSKVLKNLLFFIKWKTRFFTYVNELKSLNSKTKIERKKFIQ